MGRFPARSLLAVSAMLAQPGHRSCRLEKSQATPGPAELDCSLFVGTVPASGLHRHHCSVPTSSGDQTTTLPGHPSRRRRATESRSKSRPPAPRIAEPALCCPTVLLQPSPLSSQPGRSEAAVSAPTRRPLPVPSGRSRFDRLDSPSASRPLANPPIRSRRMLGLESTAPPLRLDEVARIASSRESHQGQQQGKKSDRRRCGDSESRRKCQS